MRNKQICIVIICLLFISFFQSQNYNYYFGNIHAHSSYSDGNKDSATSLISKPLQDFNYAKLSQHIDFYGISEHNHLSAGMTNPAHYHMGIADANAATTSSFVAMYGMEWGVISGGGHVIVYGYDSLLGWDANDYDVFVAQNDYTNLWNQVNKHPYSFAYLAHPQTTDYNNLFTSIYSAKADSAIIGMPSRSGAAFSTNSSYSDPSTGNYVSRYQDALKLGYHVGIGLDHDTHYSVFGRQTAGRLVVLAHNLTQNDIMDAFKSMRFYSSDDWNTNVDFTISGFQMGSIIPGYGGQPQINISVNDPDGEIPNKIEVFSGTPGSGSVAAVVNTATNTNTLFYTDVLPNLNCRYYYVKITQQDGDIIWTSPIWYNRNDVTGVQPQLNLVHPLKIYPNPSSNSINISFENLTGNKVLQLINMQGQLILETETPEMHLLLNLLPLSEGLYQLQVRANNNSFTEKVQIVR